MNHSNPQEWKERKLGEVIELVGGGTPKTTVSEYWNGSIPWLSVVDFNTGNKYVYNTEKSITQKGLENSSTKLLNEGDIIISARGTVGALAVLKKQMAFNQSCYGIKYIPTETNQDYLYYLMKDSINNLQQIAHGGVFDTITRETFGEIDILLPPLPEQRAIAGVLSGLDDKIDLLHQQNKTLEGMAEALWRKMFVEEAKAEWPTKQLEELCTITRGASPRPIIEYVKDGKVPWIKIADATASSSYFIDRTNEFIIEAGVIRSVKVFPGDLILSNSATCGFPYFVELEGCIHDGWLLFRDFKDVSKLFVFFFLKQLNEELNYIADGSVQNNLNTGLLKEYKLKVPPTNLINDFDIFGETAVTRIRKNTIQIRTLSRLRDELLPKLISGEVRVKP